MIAPRKPGNEPFRLAALHALPLLDTVAEPDFDAIVQLGRTLFNVPTCLVTMVDADRQWFKARSGLDATETPRSVSFCGHAILQEDVFVILDASQDERFHDNPLVTGAPYIRFYAGAPIMLPSGYTIGTVCILDPQPRSNFDDGERTRLAQLARLALTAITVRALRQDLDISRGLADRFESAMHAVPGPLALLDERGALVYFNDAFTALCPTWPDKGTELTAALGLAADAWSAEAMRASGRQEMALQIGDTSLAIYKDGGGFIVAPPALP
ncbi:MAG: GAF domain-containing protein [Ferrovibrio sp.]